MTSFEERKLAALAALVNSSSDKSPKGGLDAPIADDVEWLNSQQDVFTTSSCSGRVSLYQHAAGVSKGGRWLLVHHEQASASQVEAALETATGGGDVVLRLEPFILTAECRTVQAALALVRTALAAGFRESGVCGAQRRAVLTLRSSLRLEVPVWRGVRLVGPDALAALVAIANEKFAENERRTARLFAALRLAALSPDNHTQAAPRAAAARRSLCCRACGLLGHKAALCPAPLKQRGPPPPPHQLVQPTPSLQQQLAARQELILARICATERWEASWQLRSAQPQAEAHEAHPPALRVPVASAKAWKDALSCAGALDRSRRVGHDSDGAAVVLPVIPASLPAIADLLSRAARQGCCLVHMPRQRPVPSQPLRGGATHSQPESAMLSAPRAAFLALTSPLGCGPDGALVTDVSALGPASLGCPRERARLAALVHPHETVVDLQAGCGGYAMAALTGGNACKVIACEHRPMALACLHAALARCGGAAAARCVVCPGDARANGVLPQSGIAHRVLAPDGGSSWLATALSTLHPSRGGTLHLRVASAADADTSDALTARLRAAATQLGLRWAVRFAAAGQPLSVCGGAFHAVLDFTCEPMLPAGAVPLCWPPSRPMRRICCPDRTTLLADVMALHAPALLTDFPVGSACSSWTLEAIQGGSAGAASVHVSPSRSIDLAGHRVANTRGNFSFLELPFGEAVARMAGLPDCGGAAFPPLLCPGERMYLRSTAGAQASHFPALYPSLAAHLPLFADGGGLFDRQSYHSSVLRLSSADTHLRTHFDTADNVLIQICGTKTVTLWPPSQAHNLYCEGSSSRVHPDAMGGSPSALAREWPRAVVAQAHRTEVRLCPGEALFIPALWFHSVTSETFSASVNVFFRGRLPRELSDERDVYGNRDPPLALLAAHKAAAAAQALRELPQPYRSFYARRAAEPLLALTDEDNSTDV